MESIEASYGNLANGCQRQEITGQPVRTRVGKRPEPTGGRAGRRGAPSLLTSRRPQ